MSEKEEQIIELPVNLSVRELAERTNSSPIEVIKILMANGVMANINQLIDYDTAAIVAAELGFETTIEKSESEEESIETGEVPLWRQVISKEDPKDLQDRPPVITILGHVDHGKTTLLDAIRHSDIAGGEAGGITQHIGAYQIVYNDRLITFLDTPGHSAFTAMRSRGAQGADIVVLVVAADDGVMPQTKEAIAHAMAAQVPMIVALNKIDKQGANPDFVKKQLSDNGLVPDEWEGDTIVVPVSAKQKSGLEDLLEAILLVADNCLIQANPDGKVLGTVIEAKVEKSTGVLASLLMQNGTLNTGDIISVGKACGRIRAMFDHKGNKLTTAGPATPVQVMGLSDVPQAGELFHKHETEKEARLAVAAYKQRLKDNKRVKAKASLEELFKRYEAGEEKELRLIIKADVQGSLEPIISSLNDLDKSDISLNILHAETGNISENDVMLATASNAIVIGFNVNADAAALRLADTEGVSIRYYNIIYRLTEDVENALKGMLEPEINKKVIGTAEILQIFKISKVGNIAGCKVLNGEVRRNAKVRLKRDGEEIYDGELSSLKHEKDDVKEVRTGFECGMSIKGSNDLQIGDIIECYIVEKSKTF